MQKRSVNPRAYSYRACHPLAMTEKYWTSPRNNNASVENRERLRFCRKVSGVDHLRQPRFLPATSTITTGLLPPLSSQSTSYHLV